MEKFLLNDIEYDVIESFNTSDIEGHHEFEVKKTSKTKEKFLFWKKIKLNYRFYISRRKDFDDGWSYKFYWTKWVGDWRLEFVTFVK